MIRRFYNFVNRNWWQVVAANLGIILALLVMLLCSGCTSREQKQHAADALAGVDALKAMPLDATAALVVAGLPTRIEQAVGLPRAELPTPTMTPDAICSAPGQYANTAPPSPEPSSGLFGWILAAAGAAGAAMLSQKGRSIVSTILRCVPGPWGALADGLWSMLATRQQQAHDSRANAALASVSEAIQALDIVCEFMDGTTEHPRELARLRAVLALLRNASNPANTP